MARNKFGIIPLELGRITIPEGNDVTSQIPSKTLQLLYELGKEIDKLDESAIGINDITKIPYIHLIDLSNLFEIRTLGSVTTTDDGTESYAITFNAKQIQYQLMISGVIVYLFAHVIPEE